jgi:hypothetical protein
MGMAAGQARLLSITSRMSDNELRAQIINNNKMRLATKSSQVSEAYTTALNDARMMFSNYDKDNNATYQQLTFNALTAYNPYNNQYAISNASGQVLVSEKDAINFKDAGGDLNKFLGYYGLENTTTYFDNLNKYANADGTIPYSTGEKDDAGNAITINSGYTAEDLQAAYEGLNGHVGYNTTVASEQYFAYTTAITNFDKAYTAWTGTIADGMTTHLTSGIKYNGKTLNDISGSLDSTTDIGAMKNVLNDLQGFVNEAAKLKVGTSQASNYFSILNKQIEAARDGKTEYTKADNIVGFKGDTKNGTISFGVSADSTDLPDFTIEKQTDAGTGSVSYIVKVLDEETDPDNPTMKQLAANEYTLNLNGAGNTIELTYGTAPDQTTVTGIPNMFNGNNGDYKIIETSPVTVEDMKATGKQVIDSLENSIYTVWNPSNPAFADKSKPEYNSFVTAAKALENVIFGTSGVIQEKDYPNLVDVSWLIKNMNDTQKDKFQPILDVIILDNIMNTYGEPKYAWIDKSEVTDSYNENGDAKAQWYTNLFNRMQNGGYQVLQDGLASSTEWIEFAFESGLITLEMVDKEFNWNTLMYSSCSDITEQTDNTAITIAEAEYNAAMNKIENKDKMYDLELKNIDTEHNSLQTEYDSIKTAIDKNIERTFKIYS